MDVLGNLGIAANIMALGMVCVFAFLGLLVIAINVLAKVCPEDVKPAPKPSPMAQANTQGGVTPDVVAAISAAVSQYRKSRD